MSRQEQIERIAKVLFLGGYDGGSREEAIKMSRNIAVHLVDAGIGDKDRFEISLKGVYKRSHAHIEPIDYKEEE